jgi:hypothetical protein
LCPRERDFIKKINLKGIALSDRNKGLGELMLGNVEDSEKSFLDSP